MRTATRDLHELLESHVEHPIIHYFHPLEVYKGLPRALFVILETATNCTAALMIFVLFAAHSVEVSELVSNREVNNLTDPKLKEVIVSGAAAVAGMVVAVYRRSVIAVRSSRSSLFQQWRPSAQSLPRAGRILSSKASSD